MAILRDRFLILIILLGFIIRLTLVLLPGFKLDIDTWFAWADRLNQVGLSNFYSPQIWTNYTPGYLYILGALGFLKDLLHLNNPLFYLILKIPAIIAEIILAILIYRLVEKSLFWARLAAGLILLNLAFIFNSAIWGQIDGLFSLILILTVYFLNREKIILSAVFLGLGVLVKPQAIALLPVFLLFLIKNLSTKTFWQMTIPFLLVVLVLSLPFFINQPFSGILSLLLKMVADYPFTSLFAYNFWGVIGFWTLDNMIWQYFSYQTWGYILLAIYWITIGYCYLKRELSVYVLAALATLSFFFLPTRVHERYLYPALVFLILLSSLYKSKLLLLLTGVLSLLHLLNLYYVYVYYNEFYLKLPKVLYHPVIYQFLDTNGKNLSLISTVVFIAISAAIIRKSCRF